MTMTRLQDLMPIKGLNLSDSQGNPTDGDPGETSHCSKNWKAAAPQAKKVTLKCWDQTGMFGASCRHGFILKFCEMVQSGEL